MAGTIQFIGGNRITLSTGTAADQVSITISGPNAQTGISGIANSETTYTSGTVGLSGLANITIRSTTGNQLQFSAPDPGAGTNLSVGVSTGGNTSGNTGVATGSRLVLVGGNNVTLSQATAAGATTITMSIPNTASQTDQSAIKGLGASNTGNTAGNTGLSTGIDWVLAGSNNVTVSESTTAGGPNTIWMSGPATHAAETPLSVGVSTGGNTAGNTTVNTGSRLVLSGQANITLSEATAAGATTIGISGAAGGGGNFSAGVSTGGNTAGDTGITGTRVVFVGTNAVSLSQATDANGGTISLNVTHTTHAHTNFSGGMSTQGNTAGDTGVTGTRLVLVGTNAVSLSQATDANGGTLSLNVTHTTHGHTNLSVGVSTGGNTAGDTGVATGSRLVFSGQSNITLSQVTGAGATTIGISGPDAGAGGGWRLSLSTTDGGATTGTMAEIATGTVTLYAGNNITLSQSATNKVMISAPNTTIQTRNTIAFWNNMEAGSAASNMSTRGITADERSWIFQPLNNNNDMFPGDMTVSTALMLLNISGSTATMSQSFTSSVSLGVYTRNGSTLSLLNSASVSFGKGAAATDNSTLYAGTRWLTFGTGAWSSSPVFSEGVHYWFATAFRSSNVLNQSLTIHGQNLPWGSAATYAGTIGAASAANNTTKGFAHFYGAYTATSNSPPTSVGSNQLNKQVPLAVFIPMLIFNNINSQL